MSLSVLQLYEMQYAQYFSNHFMPGANCYLKREYTKHVFFIQNY